MTRIATLLGGLLLSRGGRRMAGRHVGKLALATLAFELWQQRRRNGSTPAAKPSARRRWSGRTS